MLNGEEHLRHRRLLQKALRARYSQGWQRRLAALRDDAMDKWPLGTPFSLLQALQDLTRATIVKLLIGWEDEVARDGLPARLAEELTGLCARAISVIEKPAMVVPLSRAPFYKPPRPAWRFFSLAPQSGLPVVLVHRAARSSCAAPASVYKPDPPPPPFDTPTGTQAVCPGEPS